MSHQESKTEAIRVIKELLAKHPPGMVVMILRELKTLLRATKDLTIFKGLVIAAATAASVQAQLSQAITTYSNDRGPQTTIISPNMSGGYNYSRIGNGGTVWGGVYASPGTTVSAAVGSRGEIVPIVTPTTPQPTVDPEASMRAKPMQMPTDDTDYYPVRYAAPRPRPTPEMWVDLYTGKPVPAPKGLKHTSEGEALINPYTHGATPTDHPPANPSPWQQYLIACKVPSNKLMRERSMFAFMEGFRVMQSYKIQIGKDPTSEKKYNQQFIALMTPLSAAQKAQIRQHLCEDFGVKDPKQIETKEMIPYLRQWIRTHVANNVAPHS